MKNLKILHKVNAIALFINLLLYITIYFGMLFQMALGFVQLTISIILIINYKQLSKKTKNRLSTYWVLVFISATLISLNLLYGNDFGNFLFVFFIPMLIAVYFYFLTATINNDSFLTANWKNLALINYEVNPSILEKYLPKGTEIDLYEGKCYVSLVGFLFQNTKLLGWKIPFHTNFEEVNLRFYVKCFENNEWKRGVVFIKEIVPKPALTLVANTIFKEHYQTLPMKHRILETEDNIEFEYQWKMYNIWNSIGVLTQKDLIPILENTEAEFICEHYFGYTKKNNLITFEYEVKHPRWEQYKVVQTEIKVNFEAVYGSDFGFLKNTDPSSVIVAKGSEISVENKKKIS